MSDQPPPVPTSPPPPLDDPILPDTPPPVPTSPPPPLDDEPPVADASPPTPADPPLTPSDPPHTPADPPHTTSDPPHTPSDPPHIPADPPHTPSDPPHTPSDPPHAPSDPPHTLDDPLPVPERLSDPVHDTSSDTPTLKESSSASSLPSSIGRDEVDHSYVNPAFIDDKLASNGIPAVIEMEQRSKKAGKASGGHSSTSSEDEQEEEDFSLLTMIPNYKRHQASVRATLQVESWWQYRRLAFYTVLGVAYLAYFIAVLVVETDIESAENYWCDADGFLIVLTGLVLVGLLYFQVVKPLFGAFLTRNVIRPIAKALRPVVSSRVVMGVFGVLVVGGIITFLVLDAQGETVRLQSLVGVATLIGFGFIFSAAPRKVRWRHVLWGMALQFTMGLLILRWPLGQAVFQCIADKVTTFLNFTDVGSAFVFSDFLVYEKSVFAFKVLTVVLFFSFCIQILYYLGVMQWIVIKLGWLLQVTVGTTACESVNAAANIFLGQTEAPLLIKPYLPLMTKSELHAVMTGGFATIAGAVLAAYISFGVDPAHLISASVMNAPSALAFSKLFYPETKKSKTEAGDLKLEPGDETNWLHAAMVGVTNALPLVANIGANLIAFYAFVEMVSHILDWGCVLAGAGEEVCSLQNIFGVVFMPLAWVMGVPWDECEIVGKLIGLKIIVNEFMAYSELSKYIEAHTISKRAETVATYALCGFSNISSIGICLGGFGAMAPERKADLASVVVRAMIAGSCATFLTACIAGTLLPSEEVLWTSTTDVINATTAASVW